ncbi:glycosyltransferase [Streptomyces sp. NP160]|uniref:glycosyltransferase n=1 Tax=Streptomyces sp. NP160 TaxID=2586637 RepID=UPI0015D5CB12|nr:glycosyltransferase [Streptomyces sp. NP160]
MSSDVAVVIGTYDGERHVAEQLASVLAQTLPPAEVLVSDDGSTDATRSEVERVAAGSPVPVRWTSSGGRLGFADNFLTGAERTRARFVAFCDQDDVWHPTKLERMRAALVEHGAVAAAHAVRLVDDAGRHTGDDDQGITRTRPAARLTGDPWQKYFGFTLLFERWLLDVAPRDQRGPDTHSPDRPLSHDRWVWFLASSLGTTVTVAERLAAYRQHGRQLYGSTGSTGGAAGRLEDLRDRARHYAASAASAGERAAFLADVCRGRADLLARGAVAERDVLDRASSRWQRLADHYAARADLHAAEGRDRLRAAAGLLGAGAYRPYRDGGLGVRALVQDALGASGLAALATVAAREA